MKPGDERQKINHLNSLNATVRLRSRAASVSDSTGRDGRLSRTLLTSAVAFRVSMAPTIIMPSAAARWQTRIVIEATWVDC